MDQNATTDLQVFVNSLDVLQGAGKILLANQELSRKVFIGGNYVLSQIAESPTGMTDELDEMANDYLVRAGDREKEMNAVRSPITQCITQLSKMFTACENIISKTTKDTPAYKLQAMRNAYSAKKADDARKLALEETRKANVTKEKGTYKAGLFQSLNTFITDQITARKKKIIDYFNEASLEDLDSRVEQLRAAKFELKDVNGWLPNLSAIYLTTDDKTSLKVEVENDLFPKLVDKWKQELEVYVIEVVDKTETKRTQLVELKQAADDQQALKKLQQQQQQQQQQEQQELQHQAEQQKQQAANQAQQIQQQANTEALFNKSTAMQTVKNAPEKPTGYNVILKNPAAGYLMMIQTWIEHVGISMNTEDLDAMTFKRIKAWVADQKKKEDKDGIVIESEYIQYLPEYKVRTTRN